MKFIVTDTRRAVYEALVATLGTLNVPDVEVEIHNSPVARFDSKGVCFVNGGNSLGVMSGKLDSELSRLVPEAEMDVVKVIKRWGSTSRDGHKYLPLFSALMSASRDRTRWLCTAPCMFTPGPGDFRNTRNSFHSTHTALSLIRESLRAGCPINTVVMTGMCTGRGRTNRMEAAKQMMEAFRLVFVDNKLATDPAMASHPRLLLNPLYTLQPLTPANEPFQTLHQYRTAGGAMEHKLPPPHDAPVIRSGGSKERSQFMTLS